MTPSRLSLCLLFGLLLSGCDSEESPAIFDDIHFKDQPPIRLDVSSIELDVEFNPTFQPPEVEQNFPVPPQRALENWVHDRMVASNPGSPYHAKVTIKDGTVLESRIPDGHAYDARGSIRVDIIDQTGTPIRTARADATMHQTVPDGTSLNDQDGLWYGMTRKLTINLGHELERQIHNSFFPYAY